MEEKKNVIIFQDESGKKTSKWSWEKCGRGIKRHKWWVIGTTIVVGALGLLANEFVLNRQTQKLNARYIYNLATEVDEKTGVERYIDGSLFNYASVISKANLEDVKNSNDAFAKINVAKIVKDNAINITKEINYQFDENDKPIKETRTVEYTITAKAKYFPTKEVGKEFIEAVIASPVASSSKAIKNYSVTSYIDDDFASLTLNQKVRLLKSQYKTIEETFENLEKKFSSSAVGNENGDTINKLFVNFKTKNSTGSSTKVDSLMGALYANSYVDYKEGEEAKIAAQIDALCKSYAQVYSNKQSDLNSLKSSLTALSNTSLIQTVTDGSEYLDTIIKLNEQILLLEDEIEDVAKVLNYGGYYLNSDGVFVFDNTDTTNAIYHLNHLTPEWVNGCKAFVEDLQATTTSLQADCEKTTAVYRYSYENYQNSVTIQETGSVQVKGGITMFVGLAAGLVLGFAVSTFVVTAIEVYKKEEEK